MLFSLPFVKLLDIFLGAVEWIPWKDKRLIVSYHPEASPADHGIMLILSFKNRSPDYVTRKDKGFIQTCSE